MSSGPERLVSASAEDDKLDIASHEPTEDELALLDQIQRRVLWLATRMVDAANHDRETRDGVKVGGHEASSASLVTVMTVLWFAHLEAEDRVSVKPHASPTFHAIQYLLGRLDRSYLTRLRALGGLQSYPSRTKDPDDVDFSTGSVGLGAAAPLFASVTRRYVDAHFGSRQRSRFISLLGDAELDEGNIWEAIGDPATQGLSNVIWIVDFNRQSLDRVVPGVRIQQWRQAFEAAGWYTTEAKYGRRLQRAFAGPGGGDLRAWIDMMPNEQYQSLFGLLGEDLRERFLDGAPDAAAEAISTVQDTDLLDLVTDLGGHDISCVLNSLLEVDRITDRPSVIFLYTVKGWGLPIAGNPRNHSALLTKDQMDDLRTRSGLSREDEWDRFAAESEPGKLCDDRRRHLSRPHNASGLSISIPSSTEVRAGASASTQEIFGRVLTNLARDPAVAPYLVTTAPDVATSTNLAGFVNQLGVFAPEPRRGWSEKGVLKWVEGPNGHHIELGISEMNLFLLLGQLGLAWDLSAQPLLPIGTVYDPFVCRGLDAFIYSVYSGARFLVSGTPSGITLAPEGGAHQSTITASVGLELPGVTLVEPAYADALDWLLCDALARIAAPSDDAVTMDPPDRGAYYFRLSTRPIDQEPFELARQRLGETTLRNQVIAGAYRLRDASAVAEAGGPILNLVCTGAVMPETLAAAAQLEGEGVAAHVIDVTSSDRLYGAWRNTLRQGIHTASKPALPEVMRSSLAPGAPVVTIHDAASHAMAWLGSALGVPCVPLGVDSFGQSGSIQELYGLHDLLPPTIVNAGLLALSEG